MVPNSLQIEDKHGSREPSTIDAFENRYVSVLIREIPGHLSLLVLVAH